MSIYALKIDNLVKLLDGISLLENEDQEKIIEMVNTLELEFAKRKTGKPAFTEIPPILAKE